MLLGTGMCAGTWTVQGRVQPVAALRLPECEYLGAGPASPARTGSTVISTSASCGT